MCIYIVLAFSFSSLSKIFAMPSTTINATNFASTTSPTTLFLFPVTYANSLLSALASKKFLIRHDSSMVTCQTRTIFFSDWTSSFTWKYQPHCRHTACNWLHQKCPLEQSLSYFGLLVLLYFIVSIPLVLTSKYSLNVILHRSKFKLFLT